MDLDHSFLSELPLQQRQKICKQIRQKQIENYLKFEKSDKGREVRKTRGDNKRKTAVHFQNNVLLQVAVDTFDDKEVARYLKNGGDPNFKTGNGTSLLHRCASEDNVSGAELLIVHRADVNIQDDDWWTPLHIACNCDSPEVLQLLLNNGGDPSVLDVDGYFPVDHAADGSESKAIIIRHMDNMGITPNIQHELRQRRPQEFLKHVKSLPLSVDVNQLLSNGSTLLHIASANGYKSCMKALFKYDPDIDKLDSYGWSPLHVAARFNQMKSVELLMKKMADDKTNVDKNLSYVQYSMENIELHIAAANGYKSCMKVLFKYDPDIDKSDNYGWSPLHVAARFNQMKSVELLLKKKADANLKDALGNKPSAVTSSNDIRSLLMRHERRQEKRTNEQDKENKQPEIPHYLELNPTDGERGHKHSEENIYTEIEEVKDIDDGTPDAQQAGLYRINSKMVKAKHGSISKEDELLEAKTRYQAMLDLESLPPPPADFLEPLEDSDQHKHNEDEDGDYVSYAIWKSGSQKEGRLATCMENDNLVSMAVVREDSLLVEIQKRFTAKQIYTNIGDVLIAVNPFKPLPYYAKEISSRYHTEDSSKLPPHVYSIAENSFQNLLRHKTSQCHVISGESGSGKTETCKYIIQHLLRVAGSEEANLNSKINQVNPLLEAFGNAVTVMNNNSSRFGKHVQLGFTPEGKVTGVTVMNNNSSRFGKHVQLGFTPEGKVTGAMISEYLLEKSRVVHQGNGEFNFHIFYWMMAGLTPEEVSMYKLTNMKSMKYITSAGTDYVYATLSENKEKFWEVKDCLKYIGFSSSDVENVFQTLSTVLHLGEIEFHGVGNNDAAQVKNPEQLSKVSELLEVSMHEFGLALVGDYTVTRGEQIKKERTVQQAEACRDALAKTLYGRLFSWIVNGINQLIQPSEEQRMELHIGILDIFGFENFPKNSFEQLCINVANEQIQMYTNDHIFYKEQQDCLLEGVPLVELNFSTNQPILDLFLERHTGVFAILDEESSFPKATDRSLATKLHQNTGEKHNQYYKTPRDGGQSFTVIHYAGSVKYDVGGMLEKNRDTLPNSIVYTMKTSNRLLIKELFQSRTTRTGSLAPSARQQRSRRTTMKKSASPFEFFKKLRGGNKEQKKPARITTAEKKGPSTVAFHFRNSLLELVSKLQSATPHFVRCIKPNTTKTAMEFVPEYVLAQLRYTGISEIVKIRKHGYALIITYYDFLNRYRELVQCCLPKFCPVSDVQKCEQVIQYYKLQDVKYGKKKLFFKQDHVEKLDRLTKELVQKITRAQSVVRGFLGRQRSKHLKSVRETQLKAMAGFGQEIKNKSSDLLDSLRNLDSSSQDDLQLQLKRAELTEITNSLGTLDDIINEYETVFNTRRVKTTTADADDDDDSYDDAISIQKNKTEITNSLSTLDDIINEYETVFNTRRDKPTAATPDDDLYDDALSVQKNKTESDVDQVFTEEMNGHIHRGLPPTPTHPAYMEQSRPPPCPREMYSQGMYASIEDQVEHRKVAPPPPRRNPETRLSTASVSSTSSVSSQGNYEELHVEEGIQYRQNPHHHGYQYHHGNENMSPRHTTHGSPIMQSKYSHEPQSPSHAGNRPFSYGAPMMHSPKHKVAPAGGSHFQYNQHQNGHSNSHPQVLHNYQYNETHSASPATSYGKHESAFHPQPHRPPPHGPPPPPPAGGPGQGHRGSPSPHPQSPKLQRHSTLDQQQRQPLRSPGSPKPIPKLSQRSQSVPTSTMFEPGYIQDQQVAPVSLGGDYMSGYHGDRAPSPPLPPPPPEMLQSSYTENSPSPPPIPTNMTSNVPPHNMQYNYNQSLPTQSAALAVAPAQMAYRQSPQRTEAQAPPPPPPLSSIPKKQNISPDRNVVNISKGASSSPSPPSGKVAPAKGGQSNGQKLMSNINNSAATDELQQKLNRMQMRNAELSGESEDSTKEDSPPPAAPIETPEEVQPVPPKPVSPSEDMFEKRLEIIQNKIKVQDPTSNDSNMDLTIDDIDLDDVPGYQPITKSTPIWKRDMIEKKNQEKIEEYIYMKQREKEEEQKWKNVPEWKRKLMKEKEKEKQTKTAEDIQKAAEEEANRKRRIREADEERKRKVKEDQEREREMEKELENVPAWKREIMMKRGGAIKNWGDEREDINEQEDYDEEEDQGYESNCQAESSSDPQRVYVQKATLVMKPQTVESSPERKKSKPPPSMAPPAAPPKRMSLDESKLEDEWDSLPSWKKEVLMKRGGAPTNWGDEREEVDE